MERSTPDNMYMVISVFGLVFPRVQRLRQIKDQAQSEDPNSVSVEINQWLQCKLTGHSLWISKKVIFAHQNLSLPINLSCACKISRRVNYLWTRRLLSLKFGLGERKINFTFWLIFGQSEFRTQQKTKPITACEHVPHMHVWDVCAHSIYS